jgi:AcrR family transcriptional regulator
MTRENIIENAVRLFKLYGIKSVTMDDIACKMGISKKTVYLHFDTKEDVLLACIDFVTSQFEEKIMIIKNTVKNPVFALVEIYHVAIVELSEFKGSYFYDIEKLHYAKEKTDEYKDHFQSVHVRALLEQAQKENYLRGDADIAILCKIFFFLMDEFIADNNYIYPKYDIDKIYRHIILFGIKGFLTKGNGELLDSYIK